MKEYDGVIDPTSEKMPELAKIAHRKWRMQRSRCNNPKVTHYENYGGKGIRVEYTSRQFIAWYIEKMKTYVGDHSRPSVGRINHEKNYNFSNIELISVAANSRERMARLGSPNPARAIVIIDKKTGERLAIANATREAAYLTGFSQVQVARLCRGVTKATRGDFLFEWHK
jgi:uncharacterized protein YkuJ